MDAHTNDGVTALMSASNNGIADVVGVLLASGQYSNMLSTNIYRQHL